MADPQTFLYIKPDYDDEAIKYLVLTEPIRDYAQSIGYQVVDLEGDSTNPATVYKAITDYDPYIIFTSGHGCTHISTSQDYNDLFWVSPGCGEHPTYSDSITMLKDRITYVLSCYCGESLVPAIVDAGGMSATGFTDEFTWVVDTDHPPEEDPYALTFFDCPNFFMTSILDGVPLSECHTRTVQRYNILIQTWRRWINENPNATSTAISRAYLTVSLLEHDRSIMRTVGDGFELVEPPLPEGKSPLGLVGVATLGAIGLKILS